MGFDGKYGKIRTEKGSIPEDEPIFLLRAQDIFAGFIVRMYSELRRSAGDEKAAEQCEGLARVMEAWPVKKKPD